ncbi:hypothetical protein MIR68_004275 [Amoeboaphelidium protococcarum]|nr:hypothetical protein MIR68_004275 [Amoeboaphelidium protococcarum]KAI3651200.1 hypothetical protein MP228_004681 [Amoeboaphelidium protococcarum]
MYHTIYCVYLASLVPGLVSILASAESPPINRPQANTPPCSSEPLVVKTATSTDCSTATAAARITTAAPPQIATPCASCVASPTPCPSSSRTTPAVVTSVQPIISTPSSNVPCTTCAYYPPPQNPPTPQPPISPPDKQPPPRPPSTPPPPPPPPSDDPNNPPSTPRSPGPRPPSSSSPKPPSNSRPRSTGKNAKGGGGGECPLIFDMNKDGVVSASLKTGISKDPSNPHLRHGGAVGGDKMLAMSDLNGNGLIDIHEVFGDQTLSPFTRKPYKASNGFDALHKLAMEMQTVPGCQGGTEQRDHDSLLVSLSSVKKCLNTRGFDLGFISDTNIAILEPLGDADLVDVTEYAHTPDDYRNGVLHGQKGSFYAKDGTKHQVDDVWFRK